MKYIKTINELDKSDLALAGGKGANLGALIKAGLPVPPGFCILTTAYRHFVASNHLEAEIARVLANTKMDQQASLDSASESIRSLFYKGVIPPALSAEIRIAHGSDHPVAVRSSATAEDLPDMSFAGQQDTYLNILGLEAVLDAVVHCWASLWTSRAIAYRAHNGISHEEVYLAVIVQEMIQSEASGVLFTANPLTEKRGETVIDAIFGLGEALVSGQVEPDHYVVNSNSGEILEKTLGSKALAIHGQAAGGTISLAQTAAEKQALPDEQIIALTRLGGLAQAHFCSPQDMEWAWAGGEMYIVQSRPITSLYPQPNGLKDNSLEIFLSFGVWQGMLDPFSPFGQDVFATFVVGVGQLFGAQIKLNEQRVFCAAGGRLFVNLTGLVKNSIGQMFAKVFVQAMDPVCGTILDDLLKDPQFKVTKKFSLKDRLKLIGGIIPFGRIVIYNLFWPERGRGRIDSSIASVLKEVQLICHSAQDMSGLIETIESLTGVTKSIFPRLVGGIAAAQMPYQILLRLTSMIPERDELIMKLSRALPYNVTTQMDLRLWQTAQVIRTDPASFLSFSTEETEDLVKKYIKLQLPKAAQNAVQGFLSDYGMRGIGEIDIYRPRWNDNPATIFNTLKSYLQISVEASPEAVFLRGVEEAKQAQIQLEDAIGKSLIGRIRKRLARVLIHRFRELGGMRESPKFFIVRLLNIFRHELLKNGQKLVDSGVISKIDDVFFLHTWELKVLGKNNQQDWKTLISERRAAYTRELRRKRIPRFLLSDGSAYYHAPSAISPDAPNTLTGISVSAGVVEGSVHVVLDPHGVQLAPGEILVCPATDPAWTPLFLTAGGLITEVGGMMTHGSVVAREYGIPAVVGVQDATLRLHDGQHIRVDGSSGMITLLDDPEI